jgi:hypothetical protein
VQQPAEAPAEVAEQPAESAVADGGPPEASNGRDRRTGKAEKEPSPASTDAAA